MKCACISDLHCILGKNSTLFKNLKNLENMELDGLFIAGDLSMHGYSFQLKPIYQWIHQLSYKTYLCLGNHDIKKDNLHHYQKFQNQQLPYFTQWLNQIPVIILNSQQQHLNEAILSNDQLNYLEDELNKYQDQWVILMIHQPLKSKINKSNSYHVGEQEEQLRKILEQHQQVVVLSGHLHNSYNTVNIDSNKNLHVNIPSFQTPSYGRKIKGLGYLMEIENNFIRFTPYNFIKQKAYERYSKTYYFHHQFVDISTAEHVSQNLFPKQLQPYSTPR